MELTRTTLPIFPQTGEDDSPSYYADSFPAKFHTRYVEECEAEHPEHFGNQALTDNLLCEVPGWDDLKPRLWTFFDSTRARNPLPEDAIFRNHAALACHIASSLYFQKRQVIWVCMPK